MRDLSRVSLRSPGLRNRLDLISSRVSGHLARLRGEARRTNREKRHQTGNFRRSAVHQHPALAYLPNAEKGKVVTATEAVLLIRDGDTVATGGFVGIGFAEEIAIALEELYLSGDGDAS